MKQTLLPIAVVLTAILALVLFPNRKGNEPMNETSAVNPVVLLETTMGNITIELDMQNAPISSENFLAYVDDEYFIDTIFHRVIPNFMVQGGGMTADGKQKKTKAPIKNEADNGLKNERGTLSMARTSDVNSATCQFFINVNDNDVLDHGERDFGYAVFARVTEGMDVVDKIVAVATGNRGGHSDVPVEAVVVEKAVRK